MSHKKKNKHSQLRPKEYKDKRMGARGRVLWGWGVGVGGGKDKRTRSVMVPSQEIYHHKHSQNPHKK